MKYLYGIIVGFFVGFFICVITRPDFGKSSKLRDYLIGTWPVSIVGFEELISTNIEKDIKHWNKVTSDVRRAAVIKTIDTDCYIITLVNREGDTSSLWLNSDGTLRTITPY